MRTALLKKSTRKKNDSLLELGYNLPDFLPRSFHLTTDHAAPARSAGQDIPSQAENIAKSAV